LKIRVERHAPNASVAYIEGDCNQKVKDILARIPAGSRTDTVLTLCFVDPYDIGIEFETLRMMSARFVDFLVLLAVFMDANQNYDRYIKTEGVRVERFLGSMSWRERWSIAQQNGNPFPSILGVRIFQEYGVPALSEDPFAYYAQGAVGRQEPSSFLLPCAVRSARTSIQILG